MVVYVVEKGRDFLLKRKTHVCLTVRQYEILQQASRDNYCTMSFIIRLAINHYISKKGWNVKYDSGKETK